MGHEKVYYLSSNLNLAVDVAFVRGSVGKNTDVVALEVGKKYRETR
jgi:hypothetical protein